MLLIALPRRLLDQVNGIKVELSYYYIKDIRKSIDINSRRDIQFQLIYNNYNKIHYKFLSNILKYYKSNIIFNIDTPNVKYYIPLIRLYRFYYYYNIKVLNKVS